MFYLIPRCGVVDLLRAIPYQTYLKRSKLVSRFYGSQWEGPDPGLATSQSYRLPGSHTTSPTYSRSTGEKGALGIAQK